MTSPTPLLFYWPTTLMMIDDSLSFLESVSFQLDERRLRVLYQDPQKALKALQANTALTDKFSTLAESFTLNELDEETPAKKLDYEALANLVYDKDRFSIISTILLDYSMPQMNGLDFCRQIQNPLIKKIMFTGEVGTDLAVTAFNEGSIHSFMAKNADSIMHQVNHAISKLKKMYFADIALSLIGKPTEKIKQNPSYLNIFEAFIRDHRIEEYYQVDHYGSYFGLDATGQIYWLMVRPEESFEEALDILKYHGDQHNLSQLLREKTYLLFLFSEEEKKLPISRWGEFLFPVVESFSCEEGVYYYAVVEGETFSLEGERMIGLQDYLKNKRAYEAT